MPKDQKPQKSASAKPIESVLRAVLLSCNAEIPITPEEVADYDRRHPKGLPLEGKERTPSMLYTWEQKQPGTSPAAAEMVPFPELRGCSSYAARTGKVSQTTKQELSDHVREMKRLSETPGR